ncbi:relaxase/mobilization nuclease-like protein [Gillisia sp. Hel_I_86]|uniref:relaxase/mobilization nuclease domain-containing protein n=1 Tax=Gillisia sp. Hel_I_86 TaxID=1249981 RepID=UPI00119AC3F6|nr:relaxase/mobilization nuclease domain-containing protein [Gillisia sp. Hel_I_86]TVZ26056.1 relaxase/mobilization nuclease-like protein [Gillisia sp. Hel_I_86]TVZ26592.1 relaxase/mobilization nuclease-like protein [Gillisia sp. Hel_I_86]
MIGKGHSIARTGASIDYGWNQEKDAEVVFKEHLAGDSPKEITEEFKIIQSQNERCVNNTLSFILSPTVEDGQQMSKAQLQEITKLFLKEMELKNRQAIAFVHRDKAHTHVHVYVNRIGFDGKAYNDSFIGKRSQLAADNVAKQLGLTRVREVQQEKLQELKGQRSAIKHISDRVLETRPKSIDEYISKMKLNQVKVIPSINKSNQLQGFRFEYKGVNLKGSDVHRSMTGGKLIGEITQNSGYTKMNEVPSSLKLLDKTVQLSANMAAGIAKNLVKQVIKRSLDVGIGF